MALSVGTWLIRTTSRRARYLFFLLPAAALLFGQLLLLSQQEQQQQQKQQEFGGSYEYDPPVLIPIPVEQVVPVARKDLEGNKSSNAASGIPQTLSNNQTTHHDDDDDDDHSSPLSSHFIQKLGANLSRVWPHKPLSSWCLQLPAFNKNNSDSSSNSNSNSTTIPSTVAPKHPEGLLLVKVPKSASSTVTGVILRIQDRHQCAKTEWRHLLAYHYANRTVTRSFLVAPIRQPESRALSNLFFHDVSFHGKRKRQRRQRTPLPPQQTDSTSSAAAAAAAVSVDIGPSDRHVRNGLLRAEPNFILQYTSLIQPPPKEELAHEHPADQQWKSANASASASLEILQEHVASVMSGYDFLIVVERLPESLVVMALLTGLHVTDLLTMSSKQAGMWYYTGRKCIALARPVQSVATRAFFQSVEWKQAHVGDALLHATAVHSLNRTIQALGEGKVQQAVADFKRWQEKVEQVCNIPNSNETQYPCSATGVPQLELAAASCYIRDFGCGYPCIDRIVDAEA